MTQQISPYRAVPSRPETTHRTIWRWAADTAWQHAPGRNRTIPHVPTTVRIHAAEIGMLHRNPNIRHVGEPRRVPGTTQPLYDVPIRYADTAHPLRSPRAEKARRIARRAAITAGGTTTLAAAGAAVSALWGDQIAAFLLHAATVGIGGATMLLIVMFWWTRHGRNGCPGIHCQGCTGSH